LCTSEQIEVTDLIAALDLPILWINTEQSNW